VSVYPGILIASGSFRGLTARGGFTVDVQWVHNRLHSFCITSQCGGVCTVRYPGISQLRANADITVFDENCIRFETVKGCRYEFTLPG